MLYHTRVSGGRCRISRIRRASLPSPKPEVSGGVFYESPNPELSRSAMRYLFLSINYTPEPTGFAPHVAAICEHLARSGDTVHLVTGFPFAPRWKRWDSYRGKWHQNHEMNGVEIHRLTHFIPRHPSNVIERMLMEASFCLHAIWHIALLRLTRHDLIVYVGAQPSIACLARFLSRLLNIPYVVEINDLAAQAVNNIGVGIID